MSEAQSPNRGKIAIIVQDSSYNRLHLMATLVGTAAALKWEAIVFLTFGALQRYVDGTMDEAAVTLGDSSINEMYQDGIEDGKIPSVTQLMEQAKELGVVKVYGCSQSTALLRLEPAQTEKLEGVVGYTTFVTAAMDAKLVVL